MPRTPRFILIIAGIASAAALAGSVLGSVQAVKAHEWIALGLEGVGVLACVFGILVAMGRFSASHALALVCVGGTLLVAPGPSYLALGYELGKGITLREFLTQLLGDWRFLTQISCGAVLFALSGLILMLRHPRASGRYLLWSAILGAPVALVGAAWTLSAVRARMESLPPIVLAGLLFAGFFILCGLISASAHCLIRALEVGKAE